MNSLMDLWLEKISEDVPKHKHDEYADKEHKHNEYATKNEAKDIAEDVVDKHEDSLHKEAKAPTMITAASIKQDPLPVLIVTFRENDEQSKLFIQKLDRVLSQSSGIDRLQIKALNQMKHRQQIEQLGLAGTGIALMRRGKLVDNMGIGNEQEIRKFVEANKKHMV